ncbi:MAG: hypothetical protein JO301_11025 [Chitinophagaceae bacterium]|nr:hypothetical protein [Chitinophagaceae bacterium]
MKLKMALTLLCLFGIGLFARSQDNKKQGQKSKPAKVNTASKHGDRYDENGNPLPPPPPPPTDRNGKPVSPEITKYTTPEKQFDKDGNPLPPPPPPPPTDRNGKPIPPSKVELQKFKDGEKPPPPPAKPRKPKAATAGVPDEPLRSN